MMDFCKCNQEIWEEETPSVPPPTPNSAFDFESAKITPVPPILNADDLELPCVRELGVKKCIDYLGDFFNCTEYEHNLLHFWFLQMVTDLLWRLQERFKLSLDMQKVALKWVLYMFNLLRGKLFPHLRIMERNHCLYRSTKECKQKDFFYNLQGSRYGGKRYDK